MLISSVFMWGSVCHGLALTHLVIPQVYSTHCAMLEVWPFLSGLLAAPSPPGGVAFIVGGKSAIFTAASH
jgi:hypothetical protein